MAKRIFEDEIGGVEKVPNGKREKPEKGGGKNKKPKRGGVRRMPHAGEAPAPFDIPVSDNDTATFKDNGEIPSETPAAPTESVGKDDKKEKMPVEIFKEKYSTLLDRDLFNKAGDSIRIVSKFYNANNGKVGVWFNPKEGKPEKWQVPVEELDEYFEDFRPKESKKERAGVEPVDRPEREPFNGQFVADEAEFVSETFDKEKRAYKNGSVPHDADDALKKRPDRKNEQETEKELDPEELKIVLEDIEGAWKDLAGIYQEDGEDKRWILRGKVAGYGKRQLANIFGVSKEQAAKIVGEAIDKIMSK